MKTLFLIDGQNNNRVTGEFDSKKEIKDFLKSKFFNTNTNETFKDFKDDFRIIDSKEMAESVKKYGKRMLKYYN